MQRDALERLLAAVDAEVSRRGDRDDVPPVLQLRWRLHERLDRASDRPPSAARRLTISAERSPTFHETQSQVWWSSRPF
jgi:hypothetical protein